MITGYGRHDPEFELQVFARVFSSFGGTELAVVPVLHTIAGYPLVLAVDFREFAVFHIRVPTLTRMVRTQRCTEHRPRYRGYGPSAARANLVAKDATDNPAENVRRYRFTHLCPRHVMTNFA